MRYPAFIGPSYTSQSKIASCDRTVNWIPELVEAPAGKNKIVLYPAPGFEVFAVLPEGPVRGLLHINGQTFAVGGSKLFGVDINGTVTQLGTGINNLGGTLVTMHANGQNGRQIFIVADSKGYIYNLNTLALTQVLDGATFGGFIDARFLALDAQTSTLKGSNLSDGTVWDALVVGQRSAGADQWASMIVTHKEIWLFGSQTTEVWYNDGGTPFPFTPNPSVFIEHGITAPYSVAILDNAPIWLGQNRDGGRIVYRANGYTPVRVSNHAVEYALAQLGTIADAESFTYQDQGHSFYVLNFPTEDQTWVYDASTNLWHERGSWDGVDFTVLPVRCHAYAFGRHLVGGRSTGNVYAMSTDIATDATE